MVFESQAGLNIDPELKQFVDNELLPVLDIDPGKFWQDFASVLSEFTPRNEALLSHRDELQEQIDDWHRERRKQGLPHDAESYKSFLKDIGYLQPQAGDFAIDTANVDSEISLQAGPQLVVPVKNARFALNATNARWGSLYDALYGTDAIPEEPGLERSGSYNPARGQRVIAAAREFLDMACPLAGATHTEVVRYAINNKELSCELASGKAVQLKDTQQFAGYQGQPQAPDLLLLRNNRLHLEIQIDPASEVGATDLAGVKDIVLEAAITTIQDCEDSVAAVDGEDKVEVYRNWLGLIRGDLEERFQKGGTEMTRRLHPDREYLSPEGKLFTLPGRSLMLVRNVGHLMRNPAVTDADGNEIFEGIMDAVVTGAIGAIDVRGINQLRNSRTGSVYIVKPKMHGPEEVRFTCELFSAVEKMLGIPELSLKVGIMDEERRTTLSLTNCIEQARDRVVFINTGFLDRTGDEIHTSMEAGPMVAKTDMKSTAWIAAYEDHNVDVGLRCGFRGRAQIGKGMWAMPDRMADMLQQKIGHPKAGANTAWVPSPTAAVLHAMHYHQVDVDSVQQSISNREGASQDDILQIPLLADKSSLTAERVQSELDNNAQGILGYVVRWVDQGIGCSKVPDINNIGLMEDRATLRISSQHIANWLHHGICSEDRVKETLLRMAAVVDEQNAADPRYQAMASDPENSIAFQAACELVFAAREQPNGYTEPILHRARLARKAQLVAD
jgi:malate synthase